MKQKAAIILGAGFSHAAGLPLLGMVFSSDPPFARSPGVRQRYDEVRTAWERWSAENPEQGEGQWLKYLYRQPRNSETTEVGFNQAMNFLLATLVQIDTSSEKAAYIHGITKSVKSPVHRCFWQFMLSCYDIESVVTMNYDILAEQGLRHEYHERFRRVPLCYYGGPDRPQIVKRMRDPARGKYVPMELTGDIALCKMHGSVNWAFEGDSFVLHEDVRAACRVEPKAGSPAIIPPMPELLKIPEWLRRVWDAAETCLGRSNVWVVCGYALPDYDGALRTLFAKASMPVRHLRLYILDPDAETVASRWRAILPDDATIHCMPGIPDALDPNMWPH